jgi:hypothetical protein
LHGRYKYLPYKIYRSKRFADHKICHIKDLQIRKFTDLKISHPKKSTPENPTSKIAIPHRIKLQSTLEPHTSKYSYITQTQHLKHSQIQLTPNPKKKLTSNRLEIDLQAPKAPPYLDKNAPQKLGRHKTETTV